MPNNMPFAQKEGTVVHAAPLDLTSVRDVQRAINLLHEKGFLQREAGVEPLRESGALDKDTHAAIVAFQRATFLPPTGQLDATTRGMLTQALAAVRATAYPGHDVQQLPSLPAPGGGGVAPSGHAQALHMAHLVDVQKAFNLLAHGGFVQLPHALPEDGALGQPTHNAIVAFQQMSGFPPTGLLDFDTRSAIAGWLQQLGVQADPGPQGTIDPAAAAAPATPHTPPPPSFGTPAGAPMVIASVQDVQNALNMLAQNGRAPLRHYLYVTGIVDHPTSDALATFQLAYGLAPSRTIDAPTRAMIAQLLGQVGVSAYSPSAAHGHAATGGLREGAPPTVDRDAQIRKVALGCLAELRHAGVNQVGDSMRYLVSTPSVDGLRAVVTNLGQQNAGGFANSVAQLWKPSLDYYMMQPNPNAAFGPEVQSKIIPLLSQVDAVLSALGQLAATPTVDNLSATVSRLSQTQGGIASHIADTLRVVLAVVTAPGSPMAAAPASAAAQPS
jgi:peptidoglycan hydrolase-like protein with peptidoglycan-binding domain